MSWRDAIDEALDETPRGVVQVSGPGGASAELDVQDSGPIGARVRRVRLTHAEDRDIDHEASRLGEALRALPHAVHPSEVAPDLGGAILRSRPDEMRSPDFFEVKVDGPRDVEVRRYRLGDDLDRQPADFDVTREGLGQLLDELDG